MATIPKNEFPKNSFKIFQSHQSATKDERGAISVIFAVLFSGFLVIGLLALVIDVGVLYQERRTLQNAADATALAIAQECAELASGRDLQFHH